MTTFDTQYTILANDILETGEWSNNRTGVRTKFKIGKLLEFDLSKEFPILTTKYVYWRSAISEMVGFIRGYDNAADFRNIGCNVWNQNANENKEWLKNPNRKGTDDLGRIYGVQWREWDAGLLTQTSENTFEIDQPVDQLKMVVDDLSKDIDNRREIVTAWNPGEMSIMALPPCHMTMIFSLVEEKTKVDLFVVIRSSDVGLGLPFNTAQYAFLLNFIARITNKKVGTLRIYLNNVHIYENHIDGIKEQLKRMPLICNPKLDLSDDLSSLEALETTSKPIQDLIHLNDYEYHPAIKLPMAV